MKYVLVFKYGVSRGQNTYGYNIVSLYVDGKKVASTCGGGYDQKGTVLGQYATALLGDKLKTLTAHYGSMDNTPRESSYYGLKFYATKSKYQQHNKYQAGDKFGIDGACGFSEVERILKAFGYTLEYITDTDKEIIYQLHTQIN